MTAKSPKKSNSRTSSSLNLPSALNSINPISTESSTPKRVPIACNFCRRRKIKCDGVQPTCCHCIGTTRICTYVRVTSEENLAIKEKKRKALLKRQGRTSDDGNKSEDRASSDEGSSSISQHSRIISSSRSSSAGGNLEREEYRFDLIEDQYTSPVSSPQQPTISERRSIDSRIGNDEGIRIHSGNSRRSHSLDYSQPSFPSFIPLQQQCIIPPPPLLQNDRYLNQTYSIPSISIHSSPIIPFSTNQRAYSLPNTSSFNQEFLNSYQSLPRSGSFPNIQVHYHHQQEQQPPPHQQQFEIAEENFPQFIPRPQTSFPSGLGFPFSAPPLTYQNDPLLHIPYNIPPEQQYQSTVPLLESTPIEINPFYPTETSNSNDHQQSIQIQPYQFDNQNHCHYQTQPHLAHLELHHPVALNQYHLLQQQQNNTNSSTTIPIPTSIPIQQEHYQTPADVPRPNRVVDQVPALNWELKRLS